jgi:hypothetical protein
MKWIQLVPIVRSFILKAQKCWTQFTHPFKSYSIFVIFTKFTCDLMEVRHLVHTVDEKQVQNDTMSLQNFTLIISEFGNNVAKLHLHSLHLSGEINNNIF